MRPITLVVFALDGVLVDTATLHARAWKRVFDRILEQRRLSPPFDQDHDYHRYVDGKPRYEAAQSFLESRSIDLPQGIPDNPPGLDSVCAVGNLEKRHYRELLDGGGVEPLPGVLDLLDRLDGAGIRMATVSSSRDADRVMQSAGLSWAVDAIVAGTEIDDLGLPGRPDPAMFVEAARRLGVDPDQTAVVDNAGAGVAAGVSGRFGLVIGFDRSEEARLKGSGACVVVSGVEELRSELLRRVAQAELPRALDRLDDILDRLGSHPGVFTDYDGTLTPIVEDPADAVIPARTRDILVRLANCCPTAVVSGRDVRDVQAMVGIEDLVYAGSHGFEIVGPDLHVEQDGAVALLPALDDAEEQLRSRLTDVEGVMVERKRFAVAVHTRRALSDVERKRTREIVEEVVGHADGLELQVGKEILELRPDMDWDKGRAIAFLMGTFEGVERAVYLGDDTTDEDAFRRLRTMDGIGIRVADDPGETEATYVLRDPDEVAEFLARLADRLCRG